MPAKTFSASGIVLKRSNIGECDRIVHLLTQDFGKMTCVAKGVRKITSSKRAFLEPGNYVKGFFVSTKSLPLLTQATLLEDCSAMQITLPRIRQLSQLLEIFESLFVEQELEPQLFRKILTLRQRVICNKASAEYVRSTFGDIITELGFQHPDESRYATLSEYMQALSDRPVRSFEYLRVE